METAEHITLKDFCQEHSQIRAADVMDVTQGAVSQMLKSDREVYIVPRGKDQYEWYEVKRKPRKKS